ncbi:MAG: hypothetical protein ABR950_05000 [Candidatus Dormibacteria bacterium]
MSASVLLATHEVGSLLRLGPSSLHPGSSARVGNREGCVDGARCHAGAVSSGAASPGAVIPPVGSLLPVGSIAARAGAPDAGAGGGSGGAAVSARAPGTPTGGGSGGAGHTGGSGAG